MTETKTYRVNQYCQEKSKVPYTDVENEKYMTRINQGQASTRLNIINGVADSCVYLGDGNFLTAGATYYLHTQIKQDPTVNYSYEVFLVNYEKYETEQYIGEIEVQPGTGQAHFECTFTPLQTEEPWFNTIVFKCSEKVTGKILYQELYLVNNIINSAVFGDSKYKNFVKMGIQANYGDRFCINGEMIMVGKSNIYEIYNDNIRVYSFSCINRCLENPSFNDSRCDFAVAKTRNVNAFILDYMYED